ncbi:protein FAR1-RELATED SEQUENCE 7-like [Magnolia sinica]|uniref:protein FAR1-RELATED SEQUENCE 7-like n=1 Tax=Magnolia sinica TaxID=86752 RepID=UPI00265A37CE|nr:protein FAR1-RELATED SEQUENCE 7-like [Magnolia sinica]
MGSTYNTSMDASMVPKDDALERWMTLDMGSAYQSVTSLESSMVPKDDPMDHWMGVDLKPFYADADEIVGNCLKHDLVEHCMVVDLEPDGVDACEMVRNDLKDDTTECCMAATELDIGSRGGESNETELSSVCKELVVYRDPLEPRVGMQFESREAGKAWYNEYARRAGFRIRVGRNERSKKDKECISQQFVCSKEGFRHKKYIERTDRVLPIPAHTREGCKAMLLLKKRGPDKWVITRFEKEHNHELVDPRKASLLRQRRRASNTSRKPLLITLDSLARQNEVIRSEEAARVEPVVGMQFDSKDAAKICYKEYAARSGFSIRVGRNERSKRDKECISWQFVCSREGFHHKKNVDGKDGTSAAGRGRPTTRGGCKAMLIVKKRGTDRWAVTRFEKTHNHELATTDNAPPFDHGGEQSNIGFGCF